MIETILKIRNSKKTKYLGYFIALLFVFNANLSYAFNEDCVKQQALYSMINSVEKSTCPSHAKNNLGNQVQKKSVECQECDKCSNINQISLIVYEFEYLVKTKGNAHNVLINKLLSQKNNPEGPPPKLFS